MTCCNDWDGFDAYCDLDENHDSDHAAEVIGGQLTWARRSA
jgi:hypothetical protein